MTGPSEEVEAVIADLEGERSRLQAQLRGAKNVQAEILAHGLKMLDEKIAEARGRRDALEARLARANRMKVITEEMKALRAEVETGAVTEERKVVLRRKRDELLQESAALLDAMRGEK